jgi:hypothetical protein
MHRLKVTFRFFPLGMTLSLLMTFLSGQDAARAQQAESPRTSPGKEVESKIGELTAALAELRAEIAESQKEARELRSELQTARKELASFMAQPATAAKSSEGILKPDNTQIEERLGKIEEEQKLLGGKIDEQYQTKVESSSKYRVRLSGIALVNIFANRGSVDNQDVPSLAQGRGALDTSGNFGATVRQSILGLEVFGPKLAGAKTGADVQFDFFGGFPNTLDGVTAGIVRLRTATVHFDWSNSTLVAGQDAPFFSPLSPTSLASLAVPALSYSGNLWTWTPQVRLEHRIQFSESSKLILQMGILDPLSGEPPSAQFYRYPQAGERSGQPAYALRTAWSRTAWGVPLTLGVGGYYDRQNWGFHRTVDAWAGTADWDVPFSRWLSLSGEFYRGRALGGLGAAEGRSVLFSGPVLSPTSSIIGVDTAGGWSQLKFHPTEKLEFNGAFGEDVPYDRSIDRYTNGISYTDSSISRNQSGFFNMIYRARSNLLFSAEYRRIWTSGIYATKYTANHLNLSVGVLF